MLADHLGNTGDAAVREAVHNGRTIRRGQGHSVRVTAPLPLHQAVLKQCAPLAGNGSTPAGRKAYRTYADRVAAVARAPLRSRAVAMSSRTSAGVTPGPAMRVVAGVVPVQAQRIAAPRV
ncbi:hypothetical protein OG948_38355 (plasmid) [Embleya sp. NBC_00888]|uniref:hypothetical protein n=1 Tax=Embleya sp. NBC_00888 TaxID=2975960 RepID=UPI002F90F88D|nr:hypothetical protein OG948_38355 [Embleya sp. NBC_00888]